MIKIHAHTFAKIANILRTLCVYYYYKCGPCGSPGGIEIEPSVTAVGYNPHTT